MTDRLALQLIEALNANASAMTLAACVQAGLFTERSAAQFCGKSLRTVQAACNKGDLPYGAPKSVWAEEKQSEAKAITLADLSEWMLGGKKEPAIELKPRKKSRYLE
jgi:hypothetical protein